MSILERPNFHAVKFTVGLMKLMKECVRSEDKDVRDFVIINIWSEIDKKLLQFIEDVNDAVDKLAEMNCHDCNVNRRIHGDDI